MVTINAGNMHFHQNDYLMKFWGRNSLKRMDKKNTDRCYVVDGRERCGKSTWAFQQMAVLEPSIMDSPEKFVSRIAFSPEQFGELSRKVKNGVYCFDEAFRGFAVRSALSKVNKQLIQVLMEMGQQNNLAFIVLPSIFMLDMYPAMLRTDGLFHISEDRRSNLRKWEGFNRRDKNKIYQKGAKKGWDYYMKTRFNGRFSGKFVGGEEFEAAYLAKKKKAFMDVEKEDVGTVLEDRYQAMSQVLLATVYRKFCKNASELSRYMKAHDIPLSPSRILEITKQRPIKPELMRV